MEHVKLQRRLATFNGQVFEYDSDDGNEHHDNSFLPPTRQNTSLVDEYDQEGVRRPDPVVKRALLGD